MAITYNDTFTAVDGTALSTHTSESGHTYTGAAELGIYTNALYKSGTDTVAKLGYVESFTTSTAYDIRLRWIKKSSNSSTDILFGVQDPDNFYMLRYRDDTYTMYVNTGGSLSVIGTPYTFVVAAGNTTAQVTLTVSGDDISVAYGATPDVITVTDATHAKNGQIGFRAQGADAGTNGNSITDVEYEAAAALANLTTTLVADASDTPLAAPVNVDITVFTAANALVGTGTINVGTNGAVSISDSNLTLEAGQNIVGGNTYRVDFQESAGDRQRSVDLVAAV